MTYKIDTTTLTGESYEMAQAVNEMGDGLQEAVEAIIKNERLKAEHFRSRLILQVHDELLVEAAKEELDMVKQILAEEMHGAANLKVCLEIDMHTGENWYEAK